MTDTYVAEQLGKELWGKLLTTIMEFAYGPDHDREIGEPELALMKILMPACADYGLTILTGRKPN
ncbi:MAG: hypothetical protein ACLPZY_08890 [Terracidiphilus sp.]